MSKFIRNFICLFAAKRDTDSEYCFYPIKVFLSALTVVTKKIVNKSFRDKLYYYSSGFTKSIYLL